MKQFDIYTLLQWIAVIGGLVLVAAGLQTNQPAIWTFGALTIVLALGWKFNR